KELAPGEKQELTLTFSLTDMASYDEEKSAYVLEQGDYLVRMGSCSDNTEVCGVVRLDQDVVAYQVKPICPGWDFEDLKPDAAVRNDERAVAAGCDAVSDVKVITIHGTDVKTLSASYRGEPKELAAGEAVSWQEVKAGTKSVDEFLAGLSVEQTAALCVGNYSEGDIQSVIGNACAKVAGGAGETTRHLDSLGLDTLSMADGPAGLRLSKEYKLVGGAAKSSDSALDGVFRDLMDEEQMKMMAAMMPQPSEEELKATVYHQYCIAIPIGTGLAQSFNTELCEVCGDIVGEEMEMFGVNLWLAPALNIQRSPLCGRNFEYYSEDPLISGKIAAAITRGVQRHKGCGTTIKHYAANNQETNRYASNSILSERALREIYLKGFEICVKESAPEAVMTSYNLINGEHTCNSYDLLTSVLRDEWGYEGVVMTDWYVTSDMMRGQASVHPFGSAAGCVKAGNHLSMAGMKSDVEDILKALEDESHPYHLTKAQLQDTARVVLKSVLRLAV
ncbi:MAG: fibronectin type III-like domain-contianing protein, partial [Lachnospiraceae bacterium]|nr:fibronectin type III-like domain-contianing protein [Lachnospiraceae bacterium]